MGVGVGVGVGVGKAAFTAATMSAIDAVVVVAGAGDAVGIYCCCT